VTNNNKKPVGFLFIGVHKHQRQERRRRRRKRRKRTHNATNKRPFLIDSQECKSQAFSTPPPSRKNCAVLERQPA